MADQNENNINEENENSIKKDEKSSSSFFKSILKLITVIVILLAAWFIGIYFTAEQTIKVTTAPIVKGLDIAKILSTTKEKVKESIVIGLGEVNTDKKLVVYTQSLPVELNKEKEKRIFNDYLFWGNATIKVRFLDNKVQYYVPLDEIKDDSFIYDESKRTIKITCPKVKIDRNMVYVQTDPAKIEKEENGSWNPFGPSLKELNDEIMSEIKNKVILDAKHPLYMEKAEKEAKIALEKLFYPVLDEFLRKENLKLELILP
jgi:hypothetical protein